MKNPKLILLIVAAWFIVPALYLYVFFPIMDTVGDELKELSLVVNIAFLGLLTTALLIALYKLIIHFSKA